MFIASACMHFVQGLVRSEVKKGRERERERESVVQVGLERERGDRVREEKERG